MTDSPTASDAHPYDALTPDVVCNAVETIGVVADGRLLALNSYENRVYQVGVEDREPVIVKFYRPGRWSDAAINEEHEFAAELQARDIPVVAPVAIDSTTLFEYAGFRWALYPRRGGHWPELDSRELLTEIGRLVARIHSVGEQKPFAARPALDAHTFGQIPVDRIEAAGVLPSHLYDAYVSVADDLLDAVEDALEDIPNVAHLRLHGDLHPSNILSRDGELNIVDLDDARTGPAIQDLWMFLSGSRDEQLGALDALLSGYNEFRRFDTRELALIEAYRSLRIVHYAGWLTARFDDPAFQQAFPWFAETRYWEEHVLALREQLAALDEEPLTWLGD